MTFNTINIAQKIVDRTIIEPIKDELDSKGINNTGEAKNSLRSQIDGDTINCYAVDYLEFLQFGRGPGKFPPVDNIRDWVRTKLGISDEQENKQVAYLVGRKIAEEGTSIYKNNSRGIQLDDKIKDLVSALQRELADGARAQVENLINQSIKNKLSA